MLPVHQSEGYKQEKQFEKIIIKMLLINVDPKV